MAGCHEARAQGRVNIDSLLYQELDSAGMAKANRMYRQAKADYEEKRYEDAMNELWAILGMSKKYMEAYYLLAEIYNDLKMYEELMSIYEMAIRNGPNANPLLYFFLGQLKMDFYEYGDAAVYLQQFLEFEGMPAAYRETAMRLLRSAEFASRSMADPVAFEPVNMGPMINTQRNEYLPSMTVNGQMLMYTRQMPLVVNNTEVSGQFQEDFVQSEKKNGQWTQGLLQTKPLNTDQYNEGGHCLSPDGKKLYFTACNKPEGQGNCDIYVSHRVNGFWDVPKNLGPEVNTPYWEAQPTIAPDGRTLYFTSSRPGSLGGMDIWKTELQADGSWSAPENLGAPINTPLSEMSPYLHPDGRTLYFASKGHLTIGGFDIVYSRKDEKGHWGEPGNPGYPVNTTGNEAYLTVGPRGDTAYYASDREGGYGGNDIYWFILPREARPVPTTWVSGRVTGATYGDALTARIDLIDMQTGKLAASTRSDKKHGRYLISLPSGRSYAFHVYRDGYLFHSGHFDLKNVKDAHKPYRQNIRLQEEGKSKTIVLNNIFFKTGSYELLPGAKAELDRLSAYLKKMNQRIEIGGHADKRGSEEENQALSKKRAEAVYEYLASQGLPEEKMNFTGYGSTRPVAEGDSPEDLAKNRRTEIKILD
jgi:outer membrane protein OmpA-like peptidoglycan-associated protein/tetratricopeptide (TPR) repeat protein